MNRFVMFSAGLLLMFSMSGCCLQHGYGGGCGGGGGYGGYGAGYPSSGGCGSCGGGCGVSPGGYPSAFAPGMSQQTAFAPGVGYPAMAMDPLPTIIR